MRKSNVVATASGPEDDGNIPFRPRLAKFEALEEAGKDLLESVKNRGVTIAKGEIRYLVDLYYQIQEFRKAAGNQRRASADDAKEPVNFVDWVFGTLEATEKLVAKALDAWTETHPTCVWAKGIMGIGPILAAGLAAHIDITKCNNPSGIWRFAGLDPSSQWKKGEKRPWNAKLKVICYLIGESFVKVSGNKRSYYGLEYKKHKGLYVAKNETGGYAAQAEQKINEKRFGAETESMEHLKKGRMPPFIIDRMAKRKAVKLFLSHWWEVAYREQYKKDPPVPYAVAILKHSGLVTAAMATGYEGREIEGE